MAELVDVLHGDALERLRELADESVHMAVTSPPFYGLRDYGTGEWSAPAEGWQGGDEGCDHLVARDPGGTASSGLAERGNALNDDTIAARAARLRPQYRDVCGKCGARRITWQGGGDEGCDHRNAPRRSFTAPAGSPKQSSNTGANGVDHLGDCPDCGATRVDHQIGLEATPEEWVDNLVGVFRELRRVLRRDGTAWLELGDSYQTHPPGTSLEGGTLTKGGKQHRANRGVSRSSGCKPKDLVGAPWMLAFALRADGWWLRDCVIWSRPNPMPESVRDRTTKAHSYVFLLSKSARYYYDQDAIREEHAGYVYNGRAGIRADGYEGAVDGGIGRARAIYVGHRDYNELGRNARSVWTIPTQPLTEPHYAAYPEELARRCILAGTSERGVCPSCGAPWRRRTVRTTEEKEVERLRNVGGRTDGYTISSTPGGLPAVTVTTAGWEPTCGHELAPVPATVLDPFLGSGTTALVARKLGRRTVGIELKHDYCELALRRLRDPAALNRHALATAGDAQLVIEDA